LVVLQVVLDVRLEFDVKLLGEGVTDRGSTEVGISLARIAVALHVPDPGHGVLIDFMLFFLFVIHPNVIVQIVEELVLV